MADGFSLDFNPIQIEKTIMDAMKNGLYAVGEAILTEATIHVPYDEEHKYSNVGPGALQDSGHVIEDGDIVYISYDTPYAVRLHEHPEYRFQGAPLRGGKWLENAVKTVAPNAVPVIARQVKRDGRLG